MTNGYVWILKLSDSLDRNGISKPGFWCRMFIRKILGLPLRNLKTHNYPCIMVIAIKIICILWILVIVYVVMRHITKTVYMYPTKRANVDMVFQLPSQLIRSAKFPRYVTLYRCPCLVRPHCIIRNKANLCCDQNERIVLLLEHFGLSSTPVGFANVWILDIC